MQGQNTATSDLLPAVHQVGEGWLEAGDGEMQKNVSWVLWEGYHQNKVPCLGYNMKITSYDYESPNQFFSESGLHLLGLSFIACFFPPLDFFPPSCTYAFFPPLALSHLSHTTGIHPLIILFYIGA